MRKSGSLLRLSGLAITGAAVAAAAGCTSGGSSSAAAPASSAVASSPATSAVAAPSSAASSAASTASSPHAVVGSAPATPVASGSAGGGGGLAGCATRDLQVKAGTAEGAAGSAYQVVDFTNIGAVACTLYGYPGVSLAAGTPVTQVGAAASRSAAAEPTVVTLQPGQVANSLLQITEAMNYPSATCSPKRTTYLQIYPPDETTPAYLSYPSIGCTASAVKLLTIGVVQTGKGTGR